MMNLVDTHCHLYLDRFRKDLDAVLQRAADAGVRKILLPSIDPQSLELMERLHHPSITFYKMAGIHPSSVQEDPPVDEEWLYEMAAGEACVAIGETGLDYYWSRDYIQEQKQSLHAHCRVAKSVGKPIVLHTRESNRDLLDLIESEQDGSLTGIWHCFTGTLEEGRRALDLGLYLGIGGVITFKNAGVDQVVGRLPLHRMVLETDAPFLAPHPKRGKRNEPAWMVYTAARLAEVMEMTPAEIAEITSSNASSLFGI